MMTLIQYVPKWVRVRLKRPSQPKFKTVSKKNRQVLPTLPKETPAAIYSEDESPAGFRLLWRL